MPGEALAAGSADDFKNLYETLNAWITGSLGKSIALTFLIVGLAVGVLRGSIVAAVVSIGVSLALIAVPSIITNIFTSPGLGG